MINSSPISIKLHPYLHNFSFLRTLLVICPLPIYDNSVFQILGISVIQFSDQVKIAHTNLWIFEFVQVKHPSWFPRRTWVPAFAGTRTFPTRLSPHSIRESYSTFQVTHCCTKSQFRLVSQVHVSLVVALSFNCFNVPFPWSFEISWIFFWKGQMTYILRFRIIYACFQILLK